MLHYRRSELILRAAEFAATGKRKPRASRAEVDIMKSKHTGGVDTAKLGQRLLFRLLTVDLFFVGGVAVAVLAELARESSHSLTDIG